MSGHPFRIERSAAKQPAVEDRPDEQFRDNARERSCRMLSAVARATRSQSSSPFSRHARHVIADDETLIHVTPDAAWLPRHGRAEVIRRSTPPRPMCVVRLFLRQGDQVFCVPRDENSRLDLPMRPVEADDPIGVLAITDLAERVTGRRSQLTFSGAVRNIVESPPDGYPWPTPCAYFGVWTSKANPVVEGTWVSIGDESLLRDRHWFPLAGHVRIR